MNRMDTPSKLGELRNPRWLEGLAWILVFPVAVSVMLGAIMFLPIATPVEILVGIPYLVTPVVFLFAMLSRDPGKVLVFGIIAALGLLGLGFATAMAIEAAIRWPKGPPGAGPDDPREIVIGVAALVWLLVCGLLVVGRVIKASSRFWYRARACVRRRRAVLWCLAGLVVAPVLYICMDASGLHQCEEHFPMFDPMLVGGSVLYGLAASCLVVALICLRGINVAFAAEHEVDNSVSPSV
jgi:hypothetical protein